MKPILIKDILNLYTELDKCKKKDSAKDKSLSILKRLVAEIYDNCDIKDYDTIIKLIDIYTTTNTVWLKELIVDILSHGTNYSSQKEKNKEVNDLLDNLEKKTPNTYPYPYYPVYPTNPCVSSGPCDPVHNPIPITYSNKSNFTDYKDLEHIYNEMNSKGEVQKK